MAVEDYRLAIDFGTSSTVAMLSRAGASPEPALFDGSPLLPSAVCADASGGFLVGRDAVHAALAAPDRFEPHPKRRIDEGAVLLGVEVPVVDLIAAVFARVGTEVRQIIGGLPSRTVITCPASWGTPRRRLLSAAATAAGLPAVELAVEPVAAAGYLLAAAGERVPDGRPLLVYDFGAGTFDATLVVRRPTGFDVLATRGLDDVGGLDIDAAVVAAIGPAGDPAWQRLHNPATAGERRAARQLWDSVRLAKESLARLPSTLIHVPLLDIEVPLGREQLDELARPIVDRTVEATRAVLAARDLRAGDLGAVLLVGGGSRLPWVATALRQAFGVDPMMIEQPELVVAKGGLLAADTVGPATPRPSAEAATGAPGPSVTVEAGAARSPAGVGTGAPGSSAAGDAGAAQQPVAVDAGAAQRPAVVDAGATRRPFAANPSVAGDAGAAWPSATVGTGSSRPPVGERAAVGPRKLGRPAILVGAAVAVILAVLVGIGLRSTLERGPSGPDPAGQSSASPTPTPSPSPSPSPSVAPTRPATFSEPVTALGWLDMTLDGAIQSGYCSPLDSADGRRYHLEGADPDVVIPAGRTRVRAAGFVIPGATGCGGRERLWITELNQVSMR